jgi:hypothetical protein
MSSRSLAVWAIGLMIGIIFSSLYGWSMALSNAALDPAYPAGSGVAASRAKALASAGMLAFVFAMHLWERYVRHVKRGELFPEFLKQ